jgi:hypothetical protein
MFLSQGGVPMPGIPIAGQGASNDNPQNYGKFQNFLPDIPPAGQGPAPSARGLTSEMFQYKSPQGQVAPSDIDSLRQQLAALQSQVSSGGGNGQFGAARPGGSWSPAAASSGSPTDGPSVMSLRGGVWS